MKSDKFEWKAGDIQMVMSQCSNCKFNQSVTGCGRYGVKPDAYVDNKEQCPEYEKE